MVTCNLKVSDNALNSKKYRTHTSKYAYKFTYTQIFIILDEHISPNINTDKKVAMTILHVILYTTKKHINIDRSGEKQRNAPEISTIQWLGRFVLFQYLASYWST